MNTNHVIGKTLTSLFTGLIASFWGIYGPVIICVLVAICMDVISGLVASMASGKDLEQSRLDRLLEEDGSDPGFGFWNLYGLIYSDFIGDDLTRAPVHDADRHDRRLLYCN